MNRNTTNDLAAGTLFNSLTLLGSGYTIGGNTIGLTGGIVTGGLSSALNVPIRLEAAQTFSVGVAVNSPIDLNGFDLTLGGSYGSLNGVISGTGNVITSQESVTLNANNTYTGTTTITAGCAINGSQAQSDVIVSQSGQLRGGGTIGNLTANGGIFPGDSDTAVLTTRSLVFNGGSSAGFDINGATPGSGYDQFRVAGTVSIAANVTAFIDLSNSFAPAVGQEFTLIDNDGTDPINGTFSGLPEGTAITLGAYQFRASYVGGDGNDFTVKTISAPKSWTGMLNGLWSAGGNWSGGVAPVAGDSLELPPGVTMNLSTTNDFAAGTLFSSLTLLGSGYTIGGNTIRLTGGIVTAGQLNALNVPIRLEAAQTFFLGGIAVNSPVDLNGFDLTLGGSFGSLNGVISGTGNVITSQESVTLNANNTYTGTTTITGGCAINGSQAQSDVTISQSGQLRGGGTIGNLTANGGIFPGDSGTAVLTTRSLAFNGGSSAGFDINGATPGSGYDQFKVAGMVSIAANVTAFIDLSNSFAPAVGQEFTLINNDGPINGAFSGLPEGTTIMHGAYQFRASYVGGDGNDFTLTAVQSALIPALDTGALLALALVLGAIAVVMLKKG